jgi:CheY-like chemotaxis protein
MTQRTLTRHGYEVLLARNGREALELLSADSQKIDAVVTDIIMPELDGLEFSKALRQAHPRIPIIACTGWGEMGVRSQLKMLGVETILEKPYRYEKLLEALDDSLSCSTRG